MPRTPRAEQFDPNQVCIVHLIQRCVRKSFLTGFDETTGKDYSHRREWIRTRMERLASVFGIDVLSTNPFATVGIVFSGRFIEPSQKRFPDATLN